MLHETYKSYKAAKRIYAKLLESKRVLYERERFQRAEASIGIDARNLWKLIKGRHGNTTSYHAIKHDGQVASSPDELRSMWCHYYKDLLNEQPNAVNDFDETFQKDIQTDILEMENSYKLNMDNTGTLTPKKNCQ